MFSVPLLRRFTVKLEQNEQNREGKRFESASCVFQSTAAVTRRINVPVRIHADLPFDGDVLSWSQAFQYAAFVRQLLQSQQQCF